MSNKKPTHYAYVVTGEGETRTWTRVGAAWANKDGAGYNIILDALPVGGRITLRTPSEKEGGAK